MVIERLIRAGKVDYQTGLSYATNANNLRVELGDMEEARLEEPELKPAPAPAPAEPETESMEIER